MTGFLFTLLGVFLAGIGARDQVTVAGLAARQGARPGLLLVAIAASFASAAAAAWAAIAIAPMLAGDARMLLAMLALGFAGLESLIIVPKPKPKEPTESLEATAVVLLAQQITDAARFLVFAIAVAVNAPVSAGIGGAAGGLASVTLAWLLPEMMTDPRLRVLRRIVGLAMLLVAVFLSLRALGHV
jgi:hypothetical protein